ncbi:RAVE protein 1 C terminal-domain-containing protein [Entophlyctis helioformis]|nr:RAVE protein 1 C terminal-domain-containing protein [Entophlyctis helioformis]
MLDRCRSLHGCRMPLLPWCGWRRRVTVACQRLWRARIGCLPHMDQGPLKMVHAFYYEPVGSTELVPADTCIHIVGVTEQAVVLVWRATFHPSAAPAATVADSVLASVTLVARSSLPMASTDLHSVHAPTDLAYFQTPLHPPGSHVFKTVSHSGTVTLWHCASGSLATSLPDPAHDEACEPAALVWVPVATVDLGPTAVLDTIVADALGKLAVVSNAAAHKPSPSGDCEVSVWSSGASGLAMSLEWSVRLAEQVVCLDWLLASDGQHLLAVGTLSRMMVYAQERLKSPSDASTWTQISCTQLQPSDPLRTLAWLHHGSLLVSTASRTMMLEKWVATPDQGVPASIFGTASDLNGRLPDHHPQLLIHYLLWGRYDVVKYNLSLLHRYASLIVGAATSSTSSSTGTIPDPASSQIVLDAPIPLWKLFGNDAAQDASTPSNHDALFAFGDDTAARDTAVGSFSLADAEHLAELLKRATFPRFGESDRTLLLALIDTFGKLDEYHKTLDDNGVRYLLFLSLFLFGRSADSVQSATASSPRVARHISRPGMPYTSQPSSPSSTGPYREADMTGLTTRDMAWAFASESQDTLVDLAARLSPGGKLLWSDARDLGLALWIRDPATLKRTFETIARNQYLGRGDDTRDPVPCSLFYLALGKKAVLLGLWRLASAHPEQAAMLKFLANDFAEERWRNSALKNAFALLGKQRYEYAVAFFLLAGKIKDAVSVCLKQLRDVQLAIAIVRVAKERTGRC